MRRYDKSEYDIILKYSDLYIGRINNKPYKPEIGETLSTEHDSVWYEIVGFPENMKPLKSKSWLVLLFKSEPFNRKRNE